MSKLNKEPEIIKIDKNSLNINQLDLDPNYWPYLLEIAKLGGLGSFIAISSTLMGKLVGKSQQTASRQLNYLKDTKLIHKEIYNKTSKIMLTEKGEIELIKLFNDLSLTFSRSLFRIEKSLLNEKIKTNKIKLLSRYKDYSIKGYTQEEFNQKFPSSLDFYNSIEWKKCRIEILKRDDYTCQCCGQKPSRQVHHINDPRHCPELCLDSKNLIILCDLCHKRWRLG